MIVDLTHMHFVRYRDGKAVEYWGVRDDLGMMQRLGVIPQLGQSGKPYPTQAPARLAGEVPEVGWRWSSYYALVPCSRYHLPDECSEVSGLR